LLSTDSLEGVNSR